MFVAIFDQVTGGLNDLLDMTENRGRSVEEINASIEALNMERDMQLEAIDAQIETLNSATFQVSDRVLELAEFFRNEFTKLLEQRFAQLEEVSNTGGMDEVETSYDPVESVYKKCLGNTNESFHEWSIDEVILPDGKTAGEKRN